MRRSHAVCRLKEKLSCLQNLKLFPVLRLVKSLKVSFRALIPCMLTPIFKAFWWSGYTTNITKMSDTITLIKTEYWDRAGGGGNISYDW